jgi:hypothetical protein
MKEEFTFYVGVDWGVEFHQACILDAHGEKICQRRRRGGCRRSRSVPKKQNCASAEQQPKQGAHFAFYKDPL